MQVTISGQFDHPELSEDTALVVALGSLSDMAPQAADHAPALHLLVDDLAFEWEDFNYPQPHHVRRLLAFLDDERPTKLHVSCYAGVSRSAAFAAVALAFLDPVLSDDEVIAYIREARPGCFPNPLILAHADALLSRDLSGACERLLGSEDWLPAGGADER